MRHDPVMLFFVEARNLSLKQWHLPTRAQVDVTMNATATGRASHRMVVIRTDGTNERIDPEEPEPERPTESTRSETNIEWRWYFDEPPTGAEEKDVVALCADYVSTLEALVDRCEAKFSGWRIKR